MAEVTNEEIKEIAQETALAWLTMIDSGEYQESWEASSGYFKKAISKEKWQESLIAIRQPLGEILSRELILSQYETSLPGAPDGEYVVMQFKTSFENKKSAVETVTPMLDVDGVWRVSGYYIR